MKAVRLTLFTALFFCLLGSSTAFADWMWRPDIGWVNTKEVIKASPEEQFKYGQRLMDEKKYKEAARAFRLLELSFPKSDEAGPSVLLASKCMYKAGYYYSCFLAAKRAIHGYADTVDLQEVVEILHKVGNDFLQGAKKEFMGLKILSGKSVAVEVFQELHLLDPWGKYGDDSLILLGRSYMRVHQYDKAIETYEQLITDYPDSPLRARARLQQAKCYDIKSKSWSYDFLSMSRALEVLKEIRPEADIAEQASELREVIENRLAHKHYETARFYIRRNRYVSARVYLEKVVNEFPDTLWAEKAREDLLEVNREINSKDEEKR
ncbi:MAG: outer membrane protein assembly factor BamD [Planctomycetota bacterium]|nr:outer membrane protein assembly factor BamD [Planctomycetota bacterium]